MTTQTQAEAAPPAQGRRRAGRALAVIGVAYTISWIAASRCQNALIES